MKNPAASFALVAAIFAWLAMSSSVRAQSDFNELYNAARAHPRDPKAWRQLGDFEDKETGEKSAVADFTRAIRLDPKFTAAYSDRADCYLAHNDWRKAIPDYTAVLRLDPQNEPAYAGRAECYYYIKRGDALDHAVADYTAAIRLSPRDANLYSNRADCYAEMGDSDEKAIADYTQVIALVSDRGMLYSAYTGRALLNNGIGHYEAAAADYTKALQLNWGNTDAYLNRGDTYAHMGDFDKAIADYSAPLAASPSFVGSHERLARLYEIMGQPEKARAEQEAVLKSRQDSVGHTMPESADLPYYNLGEIYMKRGDYPKALATFKHGMRLNPHGWDGFQELGELYTKMGDRKKAMACLDKAVDLATIADGNDDPIQTEQALYSRAESCVAMNDYAQAIADYRTLIGFSPRFPGPYAPLVRIYASCPYKKFRNGPKAIALAQKACALSGWRDSDQIEALAAAEAQTGTFDEAVKWQERAIELAGAEKGDLRKDEASMKAMAARLALYQSHKSYRQDKKP